MRRFVSFGVSLKETPKLYIEVYYRNLTLDLFRDKS